MSTPAADDGPSIRGKMEYERGFSAAMAGQVGTPPDGCMDTFQWQEGWREANRLKPKD